MSMYLTVSSKLRKASGFRLHVGQRLKGWKLVLALIGIGFCQFIYWIFLGVFYVLFGIFYLLFYLPIRTLVRFIKKKKASAETDAEVINDETT